MNNLISLPRVREITSLGKSTIYRLIDSGDFPRPIKITDRRVAWREADLAGWLSQREDVR